MLTLWNGFDRSLAGELRRMDRLFGNFDRRPAFRASSWPRVEVSETEEAFEVLAQVPGFSPGDITVTIHDGELKLEGKHEHQEKKEEGEDKRKVLFSEHRQLEFTRTFKLNVPVDGNKVTAVVKDGLLTVTLPKAEEAKPKQIAVAGE